MTEEREYIFYLHDYFGIDYDVIWKIVTNYLPDNHQDILGIIETESTKESQ